MTTQSGIEWTDATWSPVIGCTKESPGCKNCYAEREVETRWSKNPRSMWFGRKFTDIGLRAEALSQPLGWRAPRRVFVCPRADLFHPDVPFGFIAAVFGTMAVTSRHTYQVLTKRAKRMREFFETVSPEEVHWYTLQYGGPLVEERGWQWPLPNVHLGVSVENQRYADERIPELVRTPAAVRYLSCEPLLGSLNLTRIPFISGDRHRQDVLTGQALLRTDDGGLVVRTEPLLPRIHWVIAGGESGPGARPMHPDWARALRDQCQAAGVPFFFKQWGEWYPGEVEDAGDRLVASLEIEHNANARAIEGRWKHDESLGVGMFKVGKSKAGRMLDGRTWDEMPVSV